MEVRAISLIVGAVSSLLLSEFVRTGRLGTKPTHKLTINVTIGQLFDKRDKNSHTPR